MAAAGGGEILALLLCHPWHVASSTDSKTSYSLVAYPARGRRQSPTHTVSHSLITAYFRVSHVPTLRAKSSLCAGRMQKSHGRMPQVPYQGTWYHLKLIGKPQKMLSEEQYKQLSILGSCSSSFTAEINYRNKGQLGC